MIWLAEFAASLPDGLTLADLQAQADGWEEDPQQAALAALLRSDLFDADDYLQRYPDIAESGVDPVWHFVMHGVEEKRSFNLPRSKQLVQEADIAATHAQYEFDPEREDSISVMIPAYNAEQYLKRAVESVFAQTHKNLEIIIYDDGSVDNTWQVAQELAELDRRVKLLKGEENRGQGYGRNRSLEIAAGMYSAFLDADDYYAKPEFLQNQLAMLRESGADIAISPYLRYRRRRTWQDECGTGEFSGVVAAEKFLKRDFSTHAPGSKLIKTKIAKTAKFNEYGFSQDVPFILSSLLKARRVIAGGEGGYVYDMTTVSSWRPESPTPLHFYSSLRILVEIVLVCWRNNLDVREFAMLWQEEHGKRIKEYLAIPANLAFAQEILSWFNWLKEFFEQLIPEIRFYFMPAHVPVNPVALPARFRDHIASLQAGLERAIAAAPRQERKSIVIWAGHMAGGGLERVASQLGQVMADEYDVLYLLDEPQKVDYDLAGEIIESNLFDLRVHHELARAKYIFDFHWKRPNNSFPLCTYMLEKYRYKYIPTIHNTKRCDAYFDVIDVAIKKIGASSSEFPAIICVSNPVKDAFEKRYGLGDNVKVVHNPADLRECDTAAPMQKKWPYILFVGRLNQTEVKGIDILINAWAKASARKKGIKLVMAGAGELEPAIVDLINRQQLQDSIEVIGFTERIYSWIKGAEFTIIASRWEGYSMVLIESLGCGTPVLTTRVGEAEEVIANGINGELVDPDDEEQLLEGIERLTNNPLRIDKGGIAAVLANIDLTSYKKRIFDALDGG